MAIDPSIPLGARPAVFNLGELFAGMQTMRQNRLQSLQLQEAEREIDDRDAVNTVIRQHIGPNGIPDYAAAATELERQGRARPAQALRKFADERTKALIDQAHAALTNEKQTLENADMRGGWAYNILSVAKADPSKYPQARADVIKLMGENVGQFLPEKHDPQSIDTALKWWENTSGALKTRKQVIDEIQADGFKQRTEQEALKYWDNKLQRVLPTAGSQEEWTKFLMAVPEQVRGELAKTYGETYSPDAAKRAATISMTPKEREDLARQSGTAAETRRHNLRTEGLSAATNAREQAKFNATYGAGVSEDGKPLAENPTARAIAEYRIPPPSARSMASGPGQALMAQVIKINPDYRGEEFQARSRVRQQFTSGPQSQTLNSLNTAIEHLDQFVDAAQALGNGNFRPGNTAFNWLRETFGDTAPTNFQGIKTIMAGELAAAFKKSGATDQEIKEVEQAINKSNSTNQLVEYATKVAIPALGSKANAFRDQYRSVMGKNDPWSALSDSSRAVLVKHGYDPEHPTMGGAKAPAAGGLKVGDVRTKGGKKYRITAVHPDGSVDAEAVP